MSVRSELSPPAQRLSGNEGELVDVQVCVEPRLLEKLLEALAGVSFPINPEIYHQAAMGYVFADGHEELRPTTIVEFPAFSNRLGEIRSALRAGGFDPAAAHVRNMLDNIHSDHYAAAAPAGTGYTQVNLYKRFYAAEPGNISAN